jgi:hypothetical protein
MGNINDVLIERSLETEIYREYDFDGRVYRIDFPKLLMCHKGGETHRVVDFDNVVHCVPAPGVRGCVLRWVTKDSMVPVNF